MIYISTEGDVSTFDLEEFKEKFDRVISIEMFEHMKNYEALLRKISTWLKDEGKLFVHIFTHKWKPYHFKDDWMAKNFFTGSKNFRLPFISLTFFFEQNLDIVLQLLNAES